MVKHPKLILIIEDEPSLQEALQEILSAEGYRILSATDGEAGITLVLANKPDLILLDIMMPIMNGVEVLEKIRRSPAHAHTPVMLLTNTSSLEYIAKGMEYDIAGYLIKSDWSIERLVSEVKGIIDHAS